MIRRVQVYGQRCSGTNALIKLIEANFPELTFTEEFGFKHWLVPEWMTLPTDVLVVVIARAPDQWLRSLYNNPWHAHSDLKRLSFSEFIRAPWESIWDEDFWGISPSSDLYLTPIMEERCPQTGKPFANVIAKRTAKLKNWVTVAERAPAHVLVSHEMLVGSSDLVLSKIAQAAGLGQKKIWSAITSYKGEGEKLFVPKRYEPLSYDDKRHVNQYLDQSIEEQFSIVRRDQNVKFTQGAFQ